MILFTVVGARPQFIKAAAVSHAIAVYNETAADPIEERIIHTGQHYDEAMSQVFFEELKIPLPWKNLHVGSAPHGKQTGAMMESLEAIVMADPPDVIMNYGDTNSTLASALVAAKLHIPLAHVEAGLRSHNRLMPEEINRVVTDHVSTWLFCTSQAAVDNLKKEGIESGVQIVGDVMYDALLLNREIANRKSQILEQLDLEPGSFCAATIHRAETTDHAESLRGVLAGIGQIDRKIVLPLHPRTKHRLQELSLSLPDNITTVPPLSYFDMMKVVANCDFVLTDSGGLQKEAYWLGKRCITLRTETEWTELVEIGWNTVVGFSPEKILAAVNADPPSTADQNIYGDGNAAGQLVAILARSVN